MKEELKNFKPPYFIHSDIVRAHHILLSQEKFGKKTNICEKHFQFLKDKLGEKNLIFPSFNYKFGSNLKFDLFNDAFICLKKFFSLDMFIIISHN